MWYKCLLSMMLIYLLLILMDSLQRIELKNLEIKMLVPIYVNSCY